MFWRRNLPFPKALLRSETVTAGSTKEPVHAHLPEHSLSRPAHFSFLGLSSDLPERIPEMLSTLHHRVLKDVAPQWECCSKRINLAPRPPAALSAMARTTRREQSNTATETPVWGAAVLGRNWKLGRVHYAPYVLDAVTVSRLPD